MGQAGDLKIGGAEFIVLLGDALGGGAANTELFGAELFPGKAELLIDARLFGLFETLGLSGRAFIGNDGKYLLPASPGAGVNHSKLGFIPPTPQI